MGTFSPVHFIILIAFILVIGIPIVKILRRTGHSRWWVILYFVPIANLVALWVFANAKWRVSEADMTRPDPT